MMLSIGLMSGTSMDGIDAALLQTDGEAEIIELGHVHLNYAPALIQQLKAAEIRAKTGQGDLSAITDHSTRLHAKAVQALLKKTARKSTDIAVIGYHGQTLFHDASQKISLQIGDGALLAHLTGINVVNDFRQADLQAGGQGAPFAPLYHQCLARRDHFIPLAVVNCGGIANITLIQNEDLNSLIGFDTGPGNGLIDALVRTRTQHREFMDKDGQYGSKGKVHAPILEALFSSAIQQAGENYFTKMPPKSLDIRDMRLIAELAPLSLEDACKTLEAFTAESIVKSLDLVNGPIPQHWILAGGGWYNPVIRNALTQGLQARLGKQLRIETADEMGWNSQALEAQIFAHFAVRRLKNLPLTVPGTTGVSKPITGGIIHLV
ncbi:MAG: anhydro-N-acetylmuramic acid kinase [Gammaproteobacteria bacterium]|nr:anhydro-N-acetylmuramic acid kinase [Gammaproteobacteria bacterium]